MGLFSPGSPVCTISWEFFRSEDRPFLSSLKSEASSYLACCVLFAIYSQVRWWEDWEGRRKTMRIPPLLLAQSFKHLFHWHCHHFCYWHGYCRIVATMGLPWDWKRRWKTAKIAITTTPPLKEIYTLPLSFRGPISCSLGQKERVSLRALSVSIWHELLGLEL